ncbi:TIGR00730 family Rossman fold protein [Salsuginibacillus kocurii]|uniref:LOG family protein n=1 Tax=Salsuginibacillus kocurii TaxID=427078 RepID=UPI000377FC58|nr:TIGR00730 family Rossman fold protein [Salsuginibacillus kocurii]
MKNVTVFCGSREGTNPQYMEAASQLGSNLASEGLAIVYGGGSAGLMGAVADAALEEGGEVTGIIPTSLLQREIAHKNVSHLIEVETMHERKAAMYEKGDAYLALPGGIGTLEEFMEILTWHAIGEHRKPCALLNSHGYYDPLYTLLQHMVSEGFLPAEALNRIIIKNDPEQMVKALAASEDL